MPAPSQLMKLQSAAAHDDLHKRLRRVEGQVRGIQKMLDDDRECAAIVQQLNAAQAALRNATAVFMQAHAKECLLLGAELDAAERDALVDDLFRLLNSTR